MMALARPMQYFHATHFLGLPLYNSKSKSQLDGFAHRFRNDEYAEGIPRRAFRLPTSFHINVADLRLETYHDVEAASNLLHRLDMQRVLKDAITATAKIKDPLDEEDRRTETGRKAESLVSPLQVSLTVDSGRSKKDQDFYGGASDSSDRLRGVVRRVRWEFASASFRLFSGPQNHEGEYVGSKLLACKLMDARGARKSKTFVDYDGNIVRKERKPDYDATPLQQRYENVEIAGDIIIEKLSLYKEGRKRTFGGDKNEFVVDEYYEEIDSIPLSQET